jgi:hypothetical protein
VYPPPACLPRHVILARYGPRAAGALECADRSLSCLHYRNHKLDRDAPTPVNHQFRQPVKGLARARSWHRFIAAGVPAAAARRAGTGVPSGQNQAGPSMYEMEGPCPASPHQLASRLALPAPLAGARYPWGKPVSRLLSRSRVAPGGTRFQR